MRFVTLIASLILAVLASGSQAVASRDYPRPLKLEELTPEQQELMRKAMSLATPLAEERITYHFGKPAPCGKLLESGTYTGEVFEKYSRLSERGGTVAGHGVYIAGNPYSSVEYFAGGGVQVVLAPGTQVIDVTDPAVQRRMWDLGLTRSDIYNLPLDAVVRYRDRSDWFVVKGATGVRFEPIDFSKMSDSSFSRFMEGARFTLRNEQVPADLQASILERINAPAPSRGKVAAYWFFTDSSTNLERFVQLSEEARRDAMEHLRTSGKLTEFFKGLPSDLKDASHVASVGTAFDYLNTMGPEKGGILSVYLLHAPYRSRERFLALPSHLRPLAIQSALENGSIEVLQDMLRTRSFTEKSDAEILNEVKSALRSDLAARIASGAKLDLSGLRALLLIATVDEGRWVKDWEVQAWVNALPSAQRKEMEIQLATTLKKIEQGTGYGLTPSQSDFLPLGRVLAALNPPAAEGRSPSASLESKALAGRYLLLLREKYDVKNPALPRLSSTALGESCRTAMNRTLLGLTTVGGPVIVGFAVSAGLSYWDASRKAEARQAIQSLCEEEGGSYLSPSDAGPGGCRCGSSGAGRDITWTWESLGNRDPQSRICGP